MRPELPCIVTVALAVSASACDRKSEVAPEPTPAAPAVVESTTVAVVDVVDAGADAGATVVTAVVSAVTAKITTGNASVVDGISSARCQREQRCKNIGKDKDYASLEACKSKVAEDWREELNAFECPGGVDEAELAECKREIQNEGCKNPFDKLERMVACRSSEICVESR